MQGHQPALVFDVHVRPVLQDRLDGPGVVVAGGQVEWGGLSPFRGLCQATSTPSSGLE